MTKLGKHLDTSLKDLSSYNAGMTKPLLDKIFFADKVDGAQLFIDYGCADGALIEFLSTLFPNCYFIGYDENPEMMVAAAKRFKCYPVEGDFSPCEKGWTSGGQLHFTTNWAEVQRLVKLNEVSSTVMKSCLILSSVVHEMYSYHKNIIDQLWQQIWDLRTDFIALRDMMVSDSASRPSDRISVARIRQRYEVEPLREFESIWGSLNDNWSLTHFLLKYRYSSDEQWSREVRENYLPISVERLLALVPTEYAPVFIEHFTLPFLREKVWEDFGIQLQEPSHLKMILKRQKDFDEIQYRQ
jgi:hypothetical protein